jgi:hypothetical protein
MTRKQLPQQRKSPKNKLNPDIHNIIVPQEIILRDFLGDITFNIYTVTVT